MYKKQLVLQKAVCLLCVVAAALTFVYALGLMTDIYDSLYSTMRNPNDLLDTKVPGSIIYYDMQDFNRTLMGVSIGLILISCLLFITNTQSRRKYYIGNYFAIGLNAVAMIGSQIWIHINISRFKEQYLTTVDFEALRKYADMWKEYYTDSTHWFDLHYAVAVIAILAVVALLLNMVWKIILMRSEKRLVAQGSGKGMAV